MESFILFNKDQQHIYEISYKTLIDAFEYDHLGFMPRGDKILYANPIEQGAITDRDARAGETMEGDKKYFKLNCVIPPVIKNIHPTMRDEAYRMMKLDMSFLKTVTTVCDTCMVDIGVSKEGHLQTKYSRGDFITVGRGALRPDILRERNKVNYFL